MSSTFTKLMYHIVFGTKGRLPLIHQEIRNPLYDYIAGIVRREGGLLLAVGGIPDHVHLLVRLRARMPLSEVLQLIKGRSSRWLGERRDLPEPFAWQRGYGAFSVSESNVSRVRRYILTQEEHHQKESFRDELARLLQRHNLPYGEADLDDED